MTSWYEIMLGVAKVTQEKRLKSREIFRCATPHCSLICHRTSVYMEALQHILPVGSFACRLTTVTRNAAGYPALARVVAQNIG
jgi:hypothetical protein